MRALSRQLPIPALAVVLAIACAACGSSSSPGTAAASAASSGTFPVTIAAANGTVHIPARPTAIISLAPALTEMLYAAGAGSSSTGILKAASRLVRLPVSPDSTTRSGLSATMASTFGARPVSLVRGACGG